MTSLRNYSFSSLYFNNAIFRLSAIGEYHHYQISNLVCVSYEFLYLLFCVNVLKAVMEENMAVMAMEQQEVIKSQTMVCVSYEFLCFFLMYIF